MKSRITNRRALFTFLIIAAFLGALPWVSPANSTSTIATIEAVEPMPATTVAPSTFTAPLKPGAAPTLEQQKDSLLEKWVNTGELPAEVRQDNLGVHIMFLTINPDPSLGGLVNVVTTFQMLDGFWWVHATVQDRRAVATLFERGDVALVSSDIDYKATLDQLGTPEEGPSLDGVGSSDGLGPITRRLIGADDAIQLADGTGVVVAPTDTGVDFGTPGLVGKMALDGNNLPISYATAGYFMSITSKEYTITSAHTIVTKGAEDEISVMAAPYGPYILTLKQLLEYQIATLTLPDKFHAPEELPVGTTVKFGVSFIPQGPYKVAAPFILADYMDSQPGYDTLYIDYKTALLMTEYGILGTATFSEYKNAPFDFDPNTNPYAKRHGVFPGMTAQEAALNFTLAADIDGDGYNDISLGSLGNTLDVYNITKWGPSTSVNDPVLHLIDPDGDAFAQLFDEQGHGTSVAAQIAGNELTFPVYDWADEYGNASDPNVNMTLVGIAPNARILGLGGFFASGFLESWLWAAGFTPQYNGDFIEYTWTGDHMANISSNSWGYTSPTLGGVWPGNDIVSLALQVLSLPGGIDANYPGLLFVISYGNQGPGYGTGGSPMADVAIGVGASSAQNYLAFAKVQPYSTNQGHHDQVGWFSSKGPNADLYPKVDIMNTGAYDFGYSVTEVGDGFYSFRVFGGTSQAAPMTSGSLALIYSAWAKITTTTGSMRPDMAKTILMSTATDLGYDPFSQGAGRVNVSKAIQFLFGRYNTSGTFDPAMRVYTTASHQVEMNRIKTALEFFFTNTHEYGGGGIDFWGFNLTDSLSTYTSANMDDTSLFFGTVTSPVTQSVMIDPNDGSTLQTVGAYTFGLDYQYDYALTNTTARWTFYNLSAVLGATPFAQFKASDMVQFIFNTNGTAIPEANYWTYLMIWRDADNDNIPEYGPEWEVVSRTLSDVYSQSLWVSLSNLTDAEMNNLFIGVRDFLWDDPATLDENETISPDYQGIEISMSVRMYSKTTSVLGVAVSIASGTQADVSVDPAGLAPGLHSGFVTLTTSSGISALVPFSFSIPLMVDNGETAGWSTASKDAVDEPYDWDMYPSMGGDMRFFEIMFTGVTPTAAPNTLAISLNWTGKDSHVGFWLADPAGSVFEASDSLFGDLIKNYPYQGNANPEGWGYRYLVNLTAAAEFFGYNISASDFRLHVALYLDKIDTSLIGPEKITFKAAWFNGIIGQDITFPEVEIQGTVPTGAPTVHNGKTLTTGNFTIKVTQDLAGLPTAFLDEFSAKNSEIGIDIGSFLEVSLSNYTIPADDLTPTSGRTVFEYTEAVDLRAGMFVRASLDWANDKQDWDLFLLKQPGVVSRSNDVFGYQAATLAKPETASAIIDADGTYTISIDFYDGPIEDSYIDLSFIATQQVLSTFTDPNGETLSLEYEGEYLVDVTLFGFNIPAYSAKIEVDKNPPVMLSTITEVEEDADNPGMGLIGVIFDETSFNATIQLDGSTIDTLTNAEGKVSLYVDLTKISDYEPHTVKVTGNDYLGRTMSETTWQITLKDSTIPTIVSPPSDQEVSPGKTITLTWTVKDDSGGTYSITIDDNEVATGSFAGGNTEQTISYDFKESSSGEYVVKLTLTDKGGNVATDTVTIIVKSGGGGFLPFPIYALVGAFALVATMVYRRRK